MNSQTCEHCKFWSPVLRGIGKCLKEGSVDAMFWVQDASKALLTQRGFACIQFAEYDEKSGNDTL